MQIDSTSPWRNRLVLRFAEFILLHPLLRTSGAPFVGEGEKYFSVVDDTEIEICKALWEGEDYLRIPPPRRVWGCEWFDRDKFWELANFYAKCAEAATDNPREVLPVPTLNRGVWPILAYLAKPWKRIDVLEYYPDALKWFLVFCESNPVLLDLSKIVYAVPEGEVKNG